MKIFTTWLAYFLISSLVGMASLSAQSACKGLNKGKCEGNEDCTWVSNYSRKDGVNVDAYCRAKPNKGLHKTEKAERPKGLKADTKKSKKEKVSPKKKNTLNEEDMANNKNIKKEKKKKKEKKNKKPVIKDKNVSKGQTNQ